MALHSTSRNSVRRLWPEARRYIIRTYSFPLILCPQRISNFLISLLSLLFLVYLKGRTLSEESASGRTKHKINEIHKKQSHLSAVTSRVCSVSVESFSHLEILVVKIVHRTETGQVQRRLSRIYHVFCAGVGEKLIHQIVTLERGEQK